LAQKPAESDRRKVKFPQVIRHRKVEATIYGKSPQYPRYRLAYYVAGQRRLRTFGTYSEAKAEAERIIRELASGSQTAALTGEQSRDALAALERLEAFRQTTGNRVSLLAAVSEFVEAASKLKGHTLGEAVERFLGTVASMRRKNIAEAVEEFIQVDEPRTRSSEGQRSQLSAKYAYNRAIQLHRFAETFLNTTVCDLSKDHLDAFFKSLAEFSAKSRNHHRAAIRQFLSWSVRKDYLPTTHRLAEADSMRPERANTAEIAFYSPNELRKLLEAADGPIRAAVAIGGLAGLRTAELLRLDWADVWRVPGHVEITSGKSKTRQRRLVEICPSLSAWLEPFRPLADGKLWTFHEITFQQYFRDLCEQAKVKRKANGLRHAFCTYHFALHANENLTAAQAGNSPTMIHAHYKGLATKAEAEKWFAVTPTPAANVIALTALGK
jgi:integrase